MLRQFAPQFAERSRQTGQYAQQDAQEAWGAILQAAKSSALGGAQGNFVERNLMGEFEKTYVRLHETNRPPAHDGLPHSLKSAEAPDEPPSIAKEQFLEVKCNISGTTNYMMQGIAEVRSKGLPHSLLLYR